MIDSGILPLVIFAARIGETSLETIRTVYVTRGHPYLAAGIGVVKVAIWLLSTGLVITNLDNFWGIVAYVAGYGIGTVIGMDIEDRISIVSVVVRIISAADPFPLMNHLSLMGFGITRIEGSGCFSSNVAVLLMVVPRRELPRLLAVLKQEYPDVLYTVEDVRKASDANRTYFGVRSGWLTRFFGW
jgi:uncharacterized protein YebE (UPF0316 family)